MHGLVQFPENLSSRNRCSDGRRVKLTDGEIFTALVKLQLVENPSALHLEKRFQYYQQLSLFTIALQEDIKYVKPLKVIK